MPQSPFSFRCMSRARWMVLLGILTVAIALRLIDFPPRDINRNMDETGYCTGCLQLLEGITPGNKASPGGPIYWIGWAYVGGETAWDFLHPLPVEKQLAMPVRPFSALDRALFDNYRDLSALHRLLVLTNVVIALIATAAAVGLGIRLGGSLGGILLGGLFAIVPVFVDLSEMSRPYSAAWSFGITALYFTARNPDRFKAAGILLGLSIGSRIEMLCLLPLVCIISWNRKPFLKLAAISICTALLISPWLITSLVGNLRTIATVRFGGNSSAYFALHDLFYLQGFGFVVIFAFIGWFIQVAQRPADAESRLRCSLVFIYAVLLTISMLRGFADGIHQHVAALFAWMILLALVVKPVAQRWHVAAKIAVSISLLIPLVQTAVKIKSNLNLDVHENAIGWIEKHVPAGTTVYVLDGGERSLLPTPESSTSLWTEVTDDQAWRAKIQSGLDRFKISKNDLPRALAEENLVQERGNRRKWFILGGRTDLSIPRYDIRIVLGSPVFGVRDLDDAMKAHGGVLLWRDGFSGIVRPNFVTPLKQWLSADGTCVGIYCTPDVLTKVR